MAHFCTKIPNARACDGNLRQPIVTKRIAKEKQRKNNGNTREKQKNRKGKKHRPPPPTTSSKIPTDANEAPGGSSHNIIPSRSQVSETKWQPPMSQAVQSW